MRHSIRGHPDYFIKLPVPQIRSPDMGKTMGSKIPMRQLARASNIGMPVFDLSVWLGYPQLTRLCASWAFEPRPGAPRSGSSSR
jgi:hypothetical protein